MQKIKIPGILLLYNQPAFADASTIKEHVDALSNHSRFPVWKINTAGGMPRNLSRFQFSAVILHYSLFGDIPYRLFGRFIDFLAENHDAFKIAFFQDEYRYCQTRFRFINDFGIDCIFTCLEPTEFDHTYGKFTKVRNFINCLPGYVSDEMVRIADQFRRPMEQRPLDIVYRGRKLDYYMGKGGQEKYEIAQKFLEKSACIDLALDIDASENKRIYGDDWLKFLAHSKGVLGVESGVSVFDLEDEIVPQCQKMIMENPNLTFTEFSQEVLEQYEDRIYYRTVSPRHFEAAATMTCQILYEGRYSDVMMPYQHFIPLKKDFSNFDDVIKQFQDLALCNNIVEKAYEDLIASNQYSYKNFVKNQIDQVLTEANCELDCPIKLQDFVSHSLEEDANYRQRRARLASMRRINFPGKRFLKPILRPFLNRHLPI